VRRLAALYPQQTISAATIETELAQSDAAPPTSPEPQADMTLAAMVERHLQHYFATFGAQSPPPGLYHRIVEEVEGPLISAALAATRGNQIKAALLLGLNRNTLRKKISDLDIHVMKLSR